MGRSPCCEKVGLRRGRWTAEEDEKLKNYILANGEGLWKSLPKNAGLLRCGKSCRLRWVNYLRSDLKRGKFSAEEDEIIINLHSSMGNRWSVIAGFLPGRTDNEIKNYWNSHLGRRIDSYRKPNPNFVPPPATAAPSKAGKRTAATGSSVKKTKPQKYHNSSKPKPWRTPTPAPRTEESSSTSSWEEKKGENGNASMDCVTPWEDPLMELGICELGMGMDGQVLSRGHFLADADGILRTMEETEMEKDNRKCPDGVMSVVNVCRNSDSNPGSLEINSREFWHDVGSPANYSSGVGLDLDLDLAWDWDWDLGNEDRGQEHNTSSPRIPVNSNERDSDKYGEMVAWILSQ